MKNIPIKTLRANMGNFFDEVERELIRKHRAITPEQLAQEERQRKVQREYEALHTATETEADRADKDEYPDDDEGAA
jgi:hypothetical protein